MLGWTKCLLSPPKTECTVDVGGQGLGVTIGKQGLEDGALHWWTEIELAGLESCKGVWIIAGLIEIIPGPVNGFMRTLKYFVIDIG